MTKRMIPSEFKDHLSQKKIIMVFFPYGRFWWHVLLFDKSQYNFDPITEGQ